MGNIKPRIKTTEQARELGRLGGLASTPAKKLAAKIRCLKQKGLTDETAQKFYELLTDPDMTDLHIVKSLESFKEKVNDVKSEGIYNKLFMDYRKMRHGSNDKPTINIQNNIVNIDSEQLKEIIDNL